MKGILCCLFAAVIGGATNSPNTHPFDASKLRIGRDSFELVFRSAGSSPAGSLVQRVVREGDSLRVVIDNTIGTAVRQHTDILMSATTLSPLFHHEVIGVSGRRNLIGEIRFANGRALGAYATMNPRNNRIDLAIDSDVIDDEVSTALLATLPLADGYATSFRTFANPGVVETTHVTVTGRETVTVPAGTFDTYRLRVAARDTSAIFITTGEPRRLVLVRLLDGSGEMRLVK